MIINLFLFIFLWKFKAHKDTLQPLLQWYGHPGRVLGIPFQNLRDMGTPFSYYFSDLG